MILHVKQVHPRHLSARESARMAVFQYMVGNTDWSMIYFHNMELLRTDERVHIVVPYDFDSAGFVSPSYATPHEGLDIRTVRQRLYRGFCRRDVDFGDIYLEFVELRPEFEALYTEMEGLEEDKIEDALKYTAEFYDVISSESRARNRIERACRHT